MSRFPDDVIVALHTADVTVTCVPVQIAAEDWKAALFYVVPPDAACLGGGQLPGGPFKVEMEADLHDHENGTLIEIALTIDTPAEPLQGTVMFLTGHSSTHFDAMKLLSQQDDLPLFIGDQYCNILSQQRVPLNNAWRQGFGQLLDEAVGRDAVIRMTGRYDPDLVFGEILGGATSPETRS